MSAHAVTFLRRVEVASGTAAFHFERPAGFGFRPGQAIDLALPGGEEQRHAFSLVNAPDSDELVIATRLRDTPYKRALAALRPGATVNVDGPFGTLVLHRDWRRSAVMIAGGIGVTPFVSMVRHAAKEESAQRLLLCYSSRTPQEAAYLDELQRMERRLAAFRVAATMTRSSPGWTGETGRMDAARLLGIATEIAQPVWYLAGPPGFVRALRDGLLAAGVGEDDVRSEEFYGY